MHEGPARDMAVERLRSVASSESAHGPSATLPPYPVRYEIRLVEEAVVRAVRRLPDVDQERFQRQREAAYNAADPLTPVRPTTACYATGIGLSGTR